MGRLVVSWWGISCDIVLGGASGKLSVIYHCCSSISSYHLFIHGSHTLFGTPASVFSVTFHTNIHPVHSLSSSDGTGDDLIKLRPLHSSGHWVTAGQMKVQIHTAEVRSVWECMNLFNIITSFKPIVVMHQKSVLEKHFLSSVGWLHRYFTKGKSKNKQISRDFSKWRTSTL